MRVLNEITFEAKDEAEAYRLARDRLGKDAVILSKRPLKVGGFMGFFQRHTLEVSAGILQDERREEKLREKDKDDAADKERLVAFQKLLEFKQAAEGRESAKTQENAAKVIYSPAGVGNKPAQDFDSVYISTAGMASTEASGMKAPAGGGPSSPPAPSSIKEEVGDISKRLDLILERIESMTDEKPEAVKPAEKNFKEGLPQFPAQVREPNGETDRLYRQMLSAEIDPDYARQLLEEYQARQEGIPFAKWFESKIRCVSAPSGALGGRKVMLLGPTGVGKTTTIAKLAAVQALWEHKNVLLLTSDTYRIAAVDQLRTYAKILGIPIEVVFEMENFARILGEYADSDLILLDTAGRGQRDRKNLEALEVIHNTFKPDAVHLVLAANMKYRDMLDVVERMSVVPISHIIFTKLDETVTYGAIFNMLKTLDCPVSFFTTGQNVPNDIEIASGARLAGLLMGDEIRGSAL